MAPHFGGYRCADYNKCQEKVAVSEKRPHSVVSVPILGIFLVFLGVVFLLQTLNFPPWNIWGTLWRFWPVLIIISGIDINQ